MSSNQVTPLKFVFQGKDVRVVTIDSEPWFVAHEVCGALNIIHCSEFYSKLDDYDKQVVVIADEKTSRIVISKFGLCSLVHFSGAPQARAFRRWIWQEVVPATRMLQSQC